MVMQSVRQEPTEAGHVEKSGKVMQDPGVKSFGNPQGKSFTLGDSELVMNAQEGALYISMAAGNGVTLNSTTHVQIQCMGELNISGASVSLEGTEGLYIQTMTDHVELVEEVNGKSENVVLEAEIHRSFDMIRSAFDQSLASMGESALKEARLKRNWDAREKGKLDGVIEEGKSLLSMVGDVADLAFTGIVGGDNAQGLYSWVKGEEVGSLTERNATVQGTITGVNNVIDYTGDPGHGSEIRGRDLARCIQCGRSVCQAIHGPERRRQPYHADPDGTGEPRRWSERCQRCGTGC
ncbi:hypothetical protein [Paenibacillus taichungensis]